MGNIFLNRLVEGGGFIFKGHKLDIFWDLGASFKRIYIVDWLNLTTLTCDYEFECVSIT